MALALVDIDDFEALTDAQGHLRGDVVLQAVADAIGRACRSADEPARIGGDVLAVILPETDLAGARRFGEGIRRSVASLGVSVSVGVSAMEPGAADAGALVEAADVALNDAKRGGKNRTCSSDWARGPRSAPSRFGRPRTSSRRSDRRTGAGGCYLRRPHGCGRRLPGAGFVLLASAAAEAGRPAGTRAALATYGLTGGRAARGVGRARRGGGRPRRRRRPPASSRAALPPPGCSRCSPRPRPRA